MKLAVLYQPTPAHPMVLRDEHIEALSRAVPELETVRCTSEEELLARCPDADILFCWGRDTPERWVSGAGSLKWIQALSAGIDGFEPLRTLRPGLRISKIAGIHGIPMAESALMYILMFLCGMPRLMANKARHLWEKPLSPAPDDCWQKTVGIVGMGDIGSHVAEKCKAFGLTVLGCRRHPTPMANVDEMLPLTELDSLLERSDFVLCLVPLTAESVHMFGEREFRKMKPSAVFMNMGRGPVVDEAALVRALRAGELRGAALDAFETEPLPPDSPLWDMENVILTPHCSADTPFYFDRALPLLCENLRDFAAGKTMRTEVVY